MHSYTTFQLFLHYLYDTHTHTHNCLCISKLKKLVVCQYVRGLISLWLYKENKLRNCKNVFTLHIPPELHTHLWLHCSNFFNPSKKNSFGYAANRKIGKAKDLSALLCIHLSFHKVKSRVTTVHCQHKTFISVRNKKHTQYKWHHTVVHLTIKTQTVACKQKIHKKKLAMNQRKTF
jgi:hypothetical protein